MSDGRRDSFDAYMARGRAEPDREKGDPMVTAARRVADNLRARVTQGEAGRAWQEMPLSARALLVLLALDPEGDAETIARRPWGSFTADEQTTIGAQARELRRQLAGAEVLR
jgi:hypothetical protein